MKSDSVGVTPRCRHLRTRDIVRLCGFETHLPLNLSNFTATLETAVSFPSVLCYDYSRRGVQAAGEPPAFLDNLHVKVAQFAGHEIHEFRQISINEYKSGAGTGRHSDNNGVMLVGISLQDRFQSLFHPAGCAVMSDFVARGENPPTL